MDKLDIRIIRRLAQAQTVLPLRPGVGLSFRALARNLGVSEGTIRKRVHSMSASGLIKGTAVIPNPLLLGVAQGTYGFDVSSSVPKREVIERLKLVEGVFVIQNHLGSFVGVVFVYENDIELQTKLSLFRSLAQAEDGLFSRILFPPCETRLASVDWKIISRLVKGPFQTYKKLASELQLSVRTLSRELSRMVRIGAIFTFVIIDYKLIKGGITVDLLVLYTTPEDRYEAEKSVLLLVDEFLLYAGIWRDYGMYVMVLPNALAATKLSESVRQIKGVKAVRPELAEERIDQMEIFSNYVAKRIAIIKEFMAKKV